MSEAQAIADKIGKTTIAERIGVSVDAVSVSLKRGGGFPSGWFPAVRDLCADHGLDCPEGAFNWKSPRSASREAGQ